MGIMFNEVWTQARVSRLTALWAAGMSSSQIAADLGCFDHCQDRGRSAVIGKIHRLKLPPRTNGHASPRKSIATPPTEASPARPFLAPPPAPRLRNGHDPSQRRNPSHNILAAIAIAGSEPGLPENLKGDAPTGKGVQLRDLTEFNCHWPLGDPLEPGFEFCGAPAHTDAPYCSKHCRIAYTPATERRRQQPRV
jgi:GcrA cell cycle regulator